MTATEPVESATRTISPLRHKLHELRSAKHCRRRDSILPHHFCPYGVAGHRPLKATVVVQIHPQQPVQSVSSKSERQSYKLKTLESYQHGLPILPLGVEVCTPVSETGRAGALPAAAANLISTKSNHLTRGAVAVSGLKSEVRAGAKRNM